ncbi:MAG TPA: penicillin-binding transpeptidase domain-containing protein [Chitinophagaceae bacterium]|nr:penicillin-binding transpeptidase domain-containing protein [Chitinophagaceae bacterium]
MQRLLKNLAPLLLLAYCGCSYNNVTINNSLKQNFDSYHVTGTFGLFDNAHGHFTVYNLSRFKDSAYLPASTFKIVNSLVGIQTGVITNEKMVIKWDGVVRLYPGGDTAKAWNKDLTMEDAFKTSAVPYYQEVARKVGKDTMQHWLDSLGYASRYGRAVINSKIDTFWLDNSIKITADEQLGLVKKLYFNQLPFQKRAQEIVKKVMARDTTAKYKLYYKTGWGFTENGNSLGWAVGWIEENKHVYFFALNLEGAHDINMQQARLAILKNILQQLGFFEGKK